MNRKVTITLEKQLKMFSSLKFTEKGITTLKSGATVTFEETGKFHTDEEGKEHKVLRLRRDTRNYYTFDSLINS
jgi:hypothetical protein